MKNKKNLWHLVWIGGIYIVLIVILLLIIEYKVKWENKDLNTYLYFYNCSNNLCTTSEKVSTYYSRVKCEKKKCPYIKERNKNLVILANEENEYVFDYRNEKIIDNQYINYSFKNDNLIVKNKDNKYGVSSIDGTLLIEPNYNRIVDYKDGYLAYAENNKVGIVNTEKNIAISPAYDDVILIDSSKYGYQEEGKYYIASYDTELPINNISYEYIYSIDDIILVIKDKKIDILDLDLKSNLLLKIDTAYEYTKEEERGSLEIHKENNLLHFSVVNGTDTNEYIFDIKNKKLFY